MAIAFVTDSTANLAPSAAQALGVRVVPIYLFFGSEEYREGHLSYSEFLSKLTARTELPQTAPPTAAEFFKVYEELIQQGATAIVSAHVSAKLSNTYRNACIAKEMIQSHYPQVKVFPVDSQLADLALGSCIEDAVKKAKMGSPVEEVVHFLQSLCQAVRVYVYVDTLEFLKRGGRVTRLAAFFGSLLNVKPILRLAAGELSLAEKVSGKEKALDTIVQLIKKEIPPGRRLEIGVADSANPQEGDQFLNILRSQFQCEKTRRASVTPSVAIHTGPGALAAAYRLL